ncbi:MAG: hypothetical protein FD173_367 [Gallionellaceae bacterium]|nr:MAG: hypothetical protein FD173_367 [Gallionellaceae bacterium]
MKVGVTAAAIYHALRDKSETVSRKFGFAVTELYDTFGHRTVLRFSELKNTPSLLPQLFKFTPSKGRICWADNWGVGDNMRREQEGEIYVGY